MKPRARPQHRLVTDEWLCSLIAAIERLVKYPGVLADLVAALPRCDDCSDPATRAWRRGEGRWCDHHAPPGCPDYPRAEPLRRAQALLGLPRP